MSNTKKTPKLALLEAKRQAKRRQVEALFEQQQAIQTQMAALQKELEGLDDEIESLEYSQNVSEEEEESREQLPPPAASMTFPDELLSDPTTQYTQPQQQQEEEEPAQRPTSSGTMLGQLQLTRTNVSKRKQAAPPAGLKRTAATNNNNTLDHYFTKPSHTNTTTTLNNNNDNIAAQVQDLLNNTFHIQAFRGHQEEIIHSTLLGQDCFVIMRTGGGKSLTYQLPALLEGRGPQRKVTLVISPLLSLIQDQEAQLNQYCRGSAISFHSQLSKEEQAQRWNILQNSSSGVCLVLVTPEKVHKSNKLRNELEKLHQQGRLGRIVIDEAHCCSNWGHDFRPDYTKLGIFKTHFPDIPILAVTATASDRVRDDVCQILRLDSTYQFFRSSAKRPNLTYSVRRKTNKIVDDMAEFIQEHHKNNAGIIYTMTRKEADDFADKLCERGIVARSYHSSVSATKKERIHKSWMRGDTQVVVATIAFGLGINKPNVRFVLHQTISKSLEAYYQESGRAGRDGGPADCVLYYSPKDVPRIICMIHGDSGEHVFWNMARYAQASGSDAVCKGIILMSMGEPDAPNVDALMEADDGVTTERKDLGAHCKTVTALLQNKIQSGQDLTLPMLVKEWRSKNPPECVKSNPPGKELSEDDCLRIVISLILENVISPKVAFNAYGSSMYLKLGQNGTALLASPDPKVYLRLPKKVPKAAKGSSSKKKDAKKAKTDDDGWISAISSKKKKRKSSEQKGGSKAKKPKAKRATKKAEVIDLLDEASSEGEEPIVKYEHGRVSWESGDALDSSSESENEFE